MSSLSFFRFCHTQIEACKDLFIELRDDALLEIPTTALYFMHCATSVGRKIDVFIRCRNKEETILNVLYLLIDCGSSMMNTDHKLLERVHDS